MDNFTLYQLTKKLEDLDRDALYAHCVELTKQLLDSTESYRALAESVHTKAKEEILNRLDVDVVNQSSFTEIYTTEVLSWGEDIEGNKVSHEDIINKGWLLYIRKENGYCDCNYSPPGDAVFYHYSRYPLKIQQIKGLKTYGGYEVFQHLLAQGYGVLKTKRNIHDSVSDS